VECVDCPTAIIEKDGSFEEEVCANSGICKLGWTNTEKGGNGYCECSEGTKGLACNQY
jgi:hypothetical protein